jgi:hypothetical protein
VHDSQPDIPDRQLETIRQQRAHSRVVGVTVHCRHLADAAQLLQHAARGQITRVDDQVRRP